MSRTTKTTFALAVLLALAISSPAFAAVVTSNINEGGSTSGVNSTSTAWSTQGFTTDATAYTLDDVVVRFGGTGGSTSTFVDVYSATGGSPDVQPNSGGGHPDVLLETLSGSTNPQNGDFTYTSSGLSLTASTSYYLVFRVVNGGDQARMLQTSLDSETGPGTVADVAPITTNQAVSWSNHAGESTRITVNATPAAEIPEPATMSLVALGALGLIARKKRKAT